MPLIEAAVDVVTALVLTLKLAVVFPVRTVTEAGTVAAGLLLARVTTTPGEGAAPDRVTVAVDALPAVTPEGLTDNAEIDTGVGFRVSTDVTDVPL